jgi:hypothetical protein
VKRYGEAVPYRSSDGERLFSGDTGDIIEDFRALRALGVTAVDIDFETPRSRDLTRRDAPLPRAGDRSDLTSSSHAGQVKFRRVKKFAGGAWRRR